MVDLVSGYKVETSSTSVMGTSSESHLPPYNINHLELDVISLSGGYGSKRVSMNSLEEETFSSSSLETLLSNVGEDVFPVEVLMPPRIPEGDKMDLTSEIAHIMFKTAYIFSLISVGQGDVLASGNPSKERDTQKGKVKAIKLRCITLQRELAAQQEDVKAVNSFQKATKIRSSPSNLDARVTKMEDSIKDTEKWYHVAFDFVEDKTLQVEEHRKSLLQETEAHAEALKALQDEVEGLKRTLHEYLQRTMLDVLRVCE